MSVQKFFGFIFIIFVFPSSLSITTTHHDKPEETKVPIMAAKMKESEVPFKHTINATLETSERQKRLLPYYNFYLEHDFNRPQPQNSYKTNGQRYQLVPQKSTTFQQFHNKFTELVSTNNNNDGRQKIKYTPFSESNAIPGPFLPMRQVVTQNLQSPQIITQIPQQPPPKYSNNENFQITKVPNYSAIYDKLSQLKLQQQNLAQNYQGYTNQQFIRKPQVATFIPVREYPEENYKTPAKTIVQTYTPSTLEIPNNNEEFESLKSYDTYPAHQDHVLPANEEEEEQYYKDHKLVQPEVKKQKPIVILRQKPRIVPQKFYIEGQKQYLQPTKPIYFVQRKPYQKPTYNYETLRLQPVRFDNNIKYEYDDKPKPLQNIPKEPKYHLVNYNNDNKEVVINETPQKINYIKYKDPPKYQHYIVNQKSPVKYSTIEDYDTQYHPQKFVKPTFITSPNYEEQNFVPSPPVVENVAPIKEEENENSLSVILKKLQATNALPHTLTPDNIDNSIRTLVKILSSLKKKQKFSRPIVVADESGEYEEDIDNEAGVGLGGTPDILGDIFPDTPEGGTPGKPGVDYPALATIPPTSFNCKTQRYKGFFGDPDTHCQVWHYCDLNGGQASFLCPNGTIFSQVALTCDWWYNVKCSNTPQLYVLNERLYKYILPLAPKFPEDYSGPLVDRYLALKFQEMEEKMKKERKKNKEDSSDEGETSKSEEEENDDADELSRQVLLKKEREEAQETTEVSESTEE